MLQNVGDIIKRVGSCLDDPANTRFTMQYLTPLIDQHAQEMDVDLERLGMQYVEHHAIVEIAANTTDLTYLLADGQALASMKLPTGVEWKVQGQPDTAYMSSDYVNELEDVQPSSVGALEFTFIQGALSVTPSSVPLTLRITFDAMSTNLYDSAQGVIRGTAHILSYRVAAFVAGVKGMKNAEKTNGQRAMRSWNSFCNLAVMRGQVKKVVAQPIHKRNFSSQMPFIKASQ
jgi:hypothetical protein